MNDVISVLVIGSLIIGAILHALRVRTFRRVYHQKKAMLFREQDVDKSDPCIDAIRRIDAQHPIRNVIADEDERLEYDSLFWELSTYALLSVICLIATTCIAALPALVAWIIIEVAKLHVSHLATSYIMLILGSLGAIWFQISYVYGGYREAMQYANALRTVEEQYEKMRP